MAYVKAGSTIREHIDTTTNAFGYALLKRFVSSEELPAGCVADFDAGKNLLRIDKVFYDGADQRTKDRLWRTKGNVVVS